MIFPGDGRKVRESSALIRHSIEWPWKRMSSWVNESLEPEARALPMQQEHAEAHEGKHADDDEECHLDPAIGALTSEQVEAGADGEF